MGRQRRALPGPRKKRRAKKAKDLVAIRPGAIVSGGLRFVSNSEAAGVEKGAKAKREPKPKVKNDPKLVAAARELRDRWLEQVNREGFALPGGKYDVSRELQGPEAGESKQVALLPAA